MKTLSYHYYIMESRLVNTYFHNITNKNYFLWKKDKIKQKLTNQAIEFNGEFIQIRGMT